MEATTSNREAIASLFDHLAQFLSWKHEIRRSGFIPKRPSTGGKTHQKPDVSGIFRSLGPGISVGWDFSLFGMFGHKF